MRAEAHNAGTVTGRRGAMGVLLAFAWLWLMLPGDAAAQPGTILFYDNLNGNLNDFTVVATGGDASIGNETANQGRSLRLRWGPVRVYTDPIAAAVPGAELSLWIRRGDDSFSEDPDAGEDLVIEYRDAGGSWVVIDTYGGDDDSPGDIYTPTYPLPAAALHANLSIQVRTTGGDGSDYDYWHVDDITVTETAAPGGPPFGIGTCADFESGLSGWTVTATGGDAGVSAATANSPVSSLYTRWGAVSVTSDAVDLSAATLLSLDVWVRRGDDAFSENPEAGEDLVLEYRTSGGSWSALETFPGGGPAGEILTRSYPLPADALHAAFQLRIRQTGGNGADFDYWHVDDVCLTASSPIFFSFEEDSWTGAPGEVLDGGGSGLNGTVSGGASNDDSSPALMTNPGTCRYAELDGVDDYIEIADAPELDITSELTVAAWINMRSFPAELHTIVSKDWNYEYHVNSSGQVYWWWNDSTGTTRSLTTAGSINLNQWYHVAVVYESGSQTIYVNGAPWATASYNGTLRVNDLPLFIGTDWNFISRAFDGFIDEVYVIPQAYSQAEVQALRDATHDCATVGAQFTINHDNFGIHCLPETVSVDVIDSMAGTPLLNYNAQVELDSQSGNGTWTLVAGSGALNDAVADDGLATYDWPLGESQAVFELYYPQGPPVIDVDVYQVSDPGIRDTDAEGALVFSPNGFTLSPVAIGNPPVVAPFDQPRIAAEVMDVYLAAYGVTDDDPVCGVIESYTGNRTLSFWSSYLNPGSGTRNVEIDGLAAAASEAAAVPQAVVFTNGLAQVQAKYKDVGSIQILVKDDTVTDPTDLPAGIRGATSAFVSLPADFELTDIRNGPGTVVNPQAANAAGPIFIPAGTDFRATVTALDLEGDPTPNYGQESIPEEARLDVAVVAPLPAVDTPAITALVGFGAFAGGSATGFDFGWSEVGIIQLTAGIGDGDYLGAGDVTGTPSENVGRFVPYDFELAFNDPEFPTQCSPPGSMNPFSYMGSSFNYSVQPVITVTAKAFAAVNPPTTENYTGAFLKLSAATLQNWSYASASGLLLGPAAPDWSVNGTEGVMTISFDGLPSGFEFQRDPRTPFNADIDLVIDVVDGDGIASTANPATFSDIDFPAGDEIRYGRMRFTNAVGSERVDLAVPLVVEHYAGPGIGFVVNVDDECAAGVTLAFAGFTENLGPGETCVLDAGAPGASGAGCAVAAPPLLQFDEPPAAGDFNLTLAAPGLGNTGSVTVQANVPDWLKFDWNTAVPGDEDPSGQATFGLFGGDSAQIYLREVY